VVELKNGKVIRDEARALYTSMMPVVGQSRRLKDASGRDDAAEPRDAAETRDRDARGDAGEARQ
jgi:cell division transport system ATP-binding protein